RAEDAELTGQCAGPFEAMECAAAMKVDQRRRIVRADRVSDALDTFDPVNDPLEPFGTVGPVAHAMRAPRLCGRAANTRGEARIGQARGKPAEGLAPVHTPMPTGIAGPLISSARDDARTSAPPLCPCAIISALSCARRTGSASDSRRLKLLDIGEVTSTNTRRRSAARSEEHTSELQSRENLVCRLLLEKKKKTRKHTILPPK